MSNYNTLFQVCKERNDDHGNAVSVRLQGAISDLHAADGRYKHFIQFQMEFIANLF